MGLRILVATLLVVVGAHLGTRLAAHGLPSRWPDPAPVAAVAALLLTSAWIVRDLRLRSRRG